MKDYLYEVRVLVDTLAKASVGFKKNFEHTQSFVITAENDDEAKAMCIAKSIEIEAGINDIYRDMVENGPYKLLADILPKTVETDVKFHLVGVTEHC